MKCYSKKSVIFLSVLLAISLLMPSVYALEVEDELSVSDFQIVLDDLNEKYGTEMFYHADFLPDMSLAEFKAYYEEIAIEQQHTKEIIYSTLTESQIEKMEAEYKLSIESEVNSLEETPNLNPVESYNTSTPIEYIFRETVTKDSFTTPKIRFTAVYDSVYSIYLSPNNQVGDLYSYSASAAHAPTCSYYSVSYTAERIDTRRTWYIVAVGTFENLNVTTSNYRSYVEFYHIYHY